MNKPLALVLMPVLAVVSLLTPNASLAQTAPTIVAQSPSQTVLLGGTATFSVTATGSTPLSYFWRRNGALIPDATNSDYTLFNVQLSDSGSKFNCLVTNAYGPASSTNVSLKVLDTVANDLCSGAVIITSYSYTNEQSTINASSYGDPAPDCVDGFGNGVWYQFTAPVAGLLAVDTFGSDFDTGLAAYTGGCDALTEVACDDDAGGGVTSQVIVPTTAGTAYYFLAGGYGGHVGDLFFHLSFYTPPAFGVQPTNLAVVVSSNASFSPVLTGSLPMSFQWYFNSVPLTDGGGVSGSLSSLLTLANVQTNQGGNYQLVASNFVGVTTSAVAVLTPIILPPTLIQTPIDQSVGVGSNVTFSAVVDGTPPFSYQWYFYGNPLTDDGVHVVGAATANLAISNLTTADAGNYSIIVTNLSGSVTGAAMLTVLVAPTITLQPINRSVPPGLPTAFSATASGIPSPAYQWQLNGTNIPGATSGSYTINAVGASNLGSYQMVASNSTGVAITKAVPLTFGPVAAWGRNSSLECLPPAGLSNIIAVAGNYGASLALSANGTIIAWGNGAPGATSIPAAATNVVAITTSDSIENYALRADGTVVGWPTAVAPALSNIVSVAAGYGFAFALRAEGTLTNMTQSRGFNFSTNLNNVKAIACGNGSALALRSDGTVVAAGTDMATNLPIGLSNVTAIAAGYAYGMALKADGTVVAWGSGSVTNLPPGLTNIAAIAAGNYYERSGLAISSNGLVVAWGDNLSGDASFPAGLRNLDAIAVSAPANHGLALVNDGSPRMLQPPVGMTAYKGRDVTLRATVAGAPPLSYQWLLNGSNVPGATNASLLLANIQPTNAGHYQLFVSNSVATALSLPAPVNVVSNSTLFFLSQTGVSSTNVYQAGTVTFQGGSVLGNGPLTYQWYWSPTNRNYQALAGATNQALMFNPALAGQSGAYYIAISNQLSGITSAPVNVRVQFAKAWGYLATDAPFVMTNATAVAVGNAGTGTASGDYFALSSGGKISSWAGYYPSYGETNFSSLSNSFVTAIAAGYQDSLALKSDGTVFAAGYYGYGVTNVPAAVNGITAIACGDYHDLALKFDGTVMGWGQNTYGQATTSTNATNVVAIAAGGQDSIALRADGTVVTWGYEGQYQLPYGLSNVVAVAAGGTHFLALRANGTAVGWANNGAGQTSIPTAWSNLVAISAGANHSTFLRNDGAVLAVGSSYGGLFSNSVPSDLANVIAITSSGDHDLGLFGTRAPAITVQPWSRTIFNTTPNVWFCGKCVGAQPVSYQWQCNGTNVPGATNDMLTLNATADPRNQKNLIPLASGVYQLIASNAYGVVASKYAQLAVIIPLNAALNNSNVTWTTTGNALWYGETNFTHDGVAAAQSGDIGTAQQTVLQTTLVTNVAGSLTFWWQVSSQPYFDALAFSLNGSTVATISGTVNWQQVVVPISGGTNVTNVLAWTYAKQSVYSSGLDAGWVDQVTFVPNPVIVQQPVNQTNYAGTSVTFSVIATPAGQGQTGLGYQWQKNGVSLVNSVNHVAGAKTSTLSLYNIQDADVAGYSVVVTNSAGVSVASQSATLTVLDSPPSISNQPVSSTNYAGTTATFSVSGVLGAVPMAYQWQKNGINFGDGGTVSGTIALTLTKVQDADMAAYAVVVTNVYGSATSSPALLTVSDGPPVIVTPPASVVTLAGKTASFGVAANGTLPFGYQWQQNGSNLDGATNLMATLSNVQMTNVGSYQVILTNAYGATTSSVATLTLVHSLVVAWGDNSFGQTNLPAGLTNIVALAGGDYHALALHDDGTVTAWGYNDSGQATVPAGLTNVTAIAAGAFHSLALLANGTAVAWGADTYGQADVPTDLTNAVAIAGSDFSSLALRADGTVEEWGYTGFGTAPGDLTNAVAIAGGYYHNLALRADGTVAAWGYDNFGQTSVPAGLEPVVAIAAGNYHSLAIQNDGTVVAWGMNNDGETTVPTGLTNVVAIGAGTSHSLALEANGSALAWGQNLSGQSTVPADYTNLVAIAAGGQFNLAIESDGSPCILQQPASQTVNRGANARFTVGAVGFPPPSYQWWWNGTNQVGGNSAALALNSVSRAQAGVYCVWVANSIGGVLSRSATLRVLVPQLLTAPRLLPDGSVQFTASDVGGGTLSASDLPGFQAQVSTNLVNWVVLPDALSLTNGMLLLQDNAPTNIPARFYRISEQ